MHLETAMGQCEIIHVSNQSHDVNSNMLLNFVIFLKGLMAVRTYQFQHLRFCACSWTDFHMHNNLLLVDRVVMEKWARIVRSFRGVRAVWVWFTIHADSSTLLSNLSTSEKYHELRSLQRLSCFLLQGWLKPRKDYICWSCWFSTRGRFWCSARGYKATTGHPPLWDNPRILQLCWCVA